MKHSISILISLLFTITLHAQKFTVSELFSMLESGYEIFDTKLLQKGYEFNYSSDNENYTAYHYAYNRTREGNAPYHISWTQWKNGWTYISYQFTDKNDYLNFKNYLQNAGFKLDKTEANIGYLFLDYKNQNKLVTLVSGKTESDGPVVTFYEISVQFSK